MTVIRELPEVVRVCDRIKAEIGCDFVGLAFQNESGPDVKWHYATGNMNDKYQRIVVRLGKGIAGKVISSGSSLMMSNFPQDISGKMTDYPIVLAEKLVSVYAVPLFFSSVPKGVLLIGSRMPYTFSDKEQVIVCSAANNLEKVLAEKGF